MANGSDEIVPHGVEVQAIECEGKRVGGLPWRGDKACAIGGQLHFAFVDEGKHDILLDEP